MPNIFYDLSKIDFEHISLSDTFVRKKDHHDNQYFLARAKYNKNIMWGMVSPTLKIIDIEELPQNIIEITFLMSNETFANTITSLEEKCINHVYVNSNQIYGKNKSLPVIYANHQSSLKTENDTISFKVKINFNQDGTTFWAIGGTRMEPPGYDTILQYCGKIVLLFKLNGVAINRDGRFNAEWKIDQVLFKDPIENSQSLKCLIRKRKVRIYKKRKPKVDSEFEPDPELDLDHLVEIPDKIVEIDFKKRLFLKF